MKFSVSLNQRVEDSSSFSPASEIRGFGYAVSDSLDSHEELAVGLTQ